MGKSNKMPTFEVDSPPLSVPETKKVKQVKRVSDESLDNEASSKKEKKEGEQMVLSKEKVKKRKKISIDPPGQREEENRNLDFEEVTAAPIIVLPTKGAKKDKSSDENMPDEQAMSKKQKIEVESGSQSNKKAKKRALGEPTKKDESISSGFDEVVTAAPITVLPTKGAEKDKRSDENVPEEQVRSKKKKIEVESGSQSNTKAKKRALVEPTKKEDESISLNFDDEPKTPANWFKKSGTRRLFVGNLSTDVIMDDLFEFFKEAGEVIEVQLAAKKDGSFLGFGHVKFSTGTDAQRALGMNGQLFLGRRLIADLAPERGSNNPSNGKGAEDSSHFIYIKSFGKSVEEDQPKAPANLDEKSGPKRLFVGNLSSELTKDDLLEFFKKAGEVIEIQLAATEDGSFRGFGHVMFTTGADARRALEMNGQLFLGRRLIVDFAHERGSTNPSERNGAKDVGHWVFVKGFGKIIEEDMIRNLLKEHFGSCGEIIRMSIPQDNKTGRSKGFAYLLFNDQATVSKALELNGTVLGKYTLTVKEPTPKSGTHGGTYRGGRGNRRSGDEGGPRGEDCNGHGIGRRAPRDPCNRNVTTDSKAKRTTFDDDD